MARMNDLRNIFWFKYALVSKARTVCMAPGQTGNEIFTTSPSVSHRSPSNLQSRVSWSGFWHPKGGTTNLKKSSALLQLQTLLQAGKKEESQNKEEEISPYEMRGHSTCSCLASQRWSCESHQQPYNRHIKLLRELRALFSSASATLLWSLLAPSSPLAL